MAGIATNTSDKASKPNVLVDEGENAAGCDDHQGDDPGSQVDLGVDGGNEVGVNEDEDDVSDDDDTDVDETTNVRRKDKRRQGRESIIHNRMGTAT